MTGYVVTRRGPAWRDSFAGALREPEKLIWNPATWMYQTSDRTMVARVEIDGVALVLKLFFRTTLIERLENAFLRSRASRVATNIERMRKVGFRVPQLVAVLEKRPRVARGKSCAVTRLVEDGIRADKLWQQLSRGERVHAAALFGGYLRALHARGVYPQDTRVRNFLVVRDGTAWHFVLVDLDRVRVYRRLTWRRRIKNLVQIEEEVGRVSRAGERLAFLRAYLGEVERSELILRIRQIRSARLRRGALSVK
jgi:tRNA A-37 threonylcarbamoyl transferase component Bud32